MLGEVVYIAPGDGTYDIYTSLINSNTDNPATPNEYDATIFYYKGQVVTSSSVLYQSLVTTNKGNTPASSPTKWTVTLTNGGGSNKWLKLLLPVLQPLVLAWPVGYGPVSDPLTRNLYRLPHGYLREAVQNPKILGLFGAPAYNAPLDWVLEGDYFSSRQFSMIAGSSISFRFGADVASVPTMDTLFCEGLAAATAMEVCEEITQSDSLLTRIMKQFEDTMGQARRVNAIEVGSNALAEDEYLLVRL
jgi:hypothetical protein